MGRPHRGGRRMTSNSNARACQTRRASVPAPMLWLKDGRTEPLTVGAVRPVVIALWRSDGTGATLPLGPFAMRSLAGVVSIRMTTLATTTKANTLGLRDDPARTESDHAPAAAPAIPRGWLGSRGFNFGFP